MEFPVKAVAPPSWKCPSPGWAEGSVQEVPPPRDPQEQPSTLTPFFPKNGIFTSWLPRESPVLVLLLSLTSKGIREWIDLHKSGMEKIDLQKSGMVTLFNSRWESLQNPAWWLLTSFPGFSKAPASFFLNFGPGFTQFYEIPPIPCICVDMDSKSRWRRAERGQGRIWTLNLAGDESKNSRESQEVTSAGKSQIFGKSQLSPKTEAQQAPTHL